MENITFEDFQKMELRVAEIKSCEDIEGADKLYKLTIDVAEERHIVAGIKQHYTKEELVGKKDRHRRQSGAQKTAGHHVARYAAGRLQ